MMDNTFLSRREALKMLTAAAAAAFTANLTTTGGRAEVVAGATPQSALPGQFVLPPLPYAYDSLEPYIDIETMHLHHDKHHAAYIKNLNAAIDKHPEIAGRTVEALLTDLAEVPDDIRTAVRNNGGGHYNHTLYWQFMKAGGGGAPSGALAHAIDQGFGSYAAFQQQFTKSALSQFGSGWAWLTIDKVGALTIENTANQDTPLSLGRTPLLGIDVWEHAYYLKYHNVRADYVAAFYNVVNWDYVASRYTAAKG